MRTFLEIARSYIGTPFKHQGRLPGVGLDCAGVVVCALIESGKQVQDVLGYGRIPSKGLFQRMVDQQCDNINIDEIKDGDLMMFAFRTDSQHIAIYDNGMIIHAYSEVGKVVRNSLDDAWRERLRGCYRIKE